MFERKSKLSQEAAEQCLAFGIRKAARVMTQRYNEALAPTGLRSTQFMVLNAISRADGVSINQLADGLVMDRTTLTRNLKPLQKSGLVELGPGPDARTKAVRLTGPGRKALRKALPLWAKAQKATKEALGASRSGRLQKDLREVVGLAG
jgi:DNA-binding MarR family transcriptional regulator